MRSSSPANHNGSPSCSQLPASRTAGIFRASLRINEFCRNYAKGRCRFTAEECDRIHAISDPSPSPQLRHANYSSSAPSAFVIAPSTAKRKCVDIFLEFDASHSERRISGYPVELGASRVSSQPNRYYNHQSPNQFNNRPVEDWTIIGFSMDTAGGVERSLYRILQIRVGLATWDDAHGEISVPENFIVIPKLSRDTVVIGMSFLRKPEVGGFVDVARSRPTFSGSWYSNGGLLSIQFVNPGALSTMRVITIPDGCLLHYEPPPEPRDCFRSTPSST
jgi:hypothetical protein